MTIYDREYISRLIDSIYRQGFIPAPEVKPQQVSTIPEAGRSGAQSSSPAKPASAGGPGWAVAQDYYFLKDSPAPNLTVRPFHSRLFSYDAEKIRRDFPILERRINGQPLIWFDNAATTQKPLPVIDTISRFYREYNSNVHRGAHTLADLATEAYEAAREKVRQFIGARSASEIIFVRGATEAINLVAQSYGKIHIGKGDEILISVMEHHSNIVPWQLLGGQTGAIIRPIPITERGEIMLDAYEKMLSRRTKLVAVTQVSNVLGTINPVRLMAEMAHYHGARIMVDGAQAVPHLTVDVTEMDADFYCFSGHKVYGPTGIGVLYGKRELLEEMPPWQGGGGMIARVDFDKTTYNNLPHKFEAGTVNIAGAVGLGAAVDYLQQTGLAGIERYERELTGYTTDLLSNIPGLRLFGTAPRKTAVIAFAIPDVPPDDLARCLDQHGIAVRAGHHCAQPLMKRYGQKSMLRVSLGLYNTREEADKLGEVIRQTVRNFRLN